MRTKDSYALHLNQMRITPIKARSVLTLSLPAGMQNAIFAIANLFIQAGVNSFPAVVVEGNSAAANADALVYDVMAAFYTACSSFMSQNFGAGNRKRVIRSYYISLAYSFGIGAVLGGMLSCCIKLPPIKFRLNRAGQLAQCAGLKHLHARILPEYRPD